MIGVKEMSELYECDLCGEYKEELSVIRYCDECEEETGK